MSETISTSVSAAEIFSAEDILGGPPKRKDIVEGEKNGMDSGVRPGQVGCCICSGVAAAGVECTGVTHRPGIFALFCRSSLPLLLLPLRDVMLAARTGPNALVSPAMGV